MGHHGTRCYKSLNKLSFQWHRHHVANSPGKCHAACPSAVVGQLIKINETIRSKITLSNRHSFGLAFSSDVKKPSIKTMGKAPFVPDSPPSQTKIVNNQKQQFNFMQDNLCCRTGLGLTDSWWVPCLNSPTAVEIWGFWSRVKMIQSVAVWFLPKFLYRQFQNISHCFRFHQPIPEFLNIWTGTTGFSNFHGKRTGSPILVSFKSMKWHRRKPRQKRHRRTIKLNWTKSSRQRWSFTDSIKSDFVAMTLVCLMIGTQIECCHNRVQVGLRHT